MGQATVAADGTFQVMFQNVMIPGAANPVTGMDLTANVTLDGTIRSPDRYCGDVTGMVTAPVALDLSGSHFGAIRVSATAIGSSLPAPDFTCPAGGPVDGGNRG
jgi:hypothetical protein